MSNTAIEWTDETWNPTVGCSLVSPGCSGCYAMRHAARLQRMRRHPLPQYEGVTQSSKGGPVWTGRVNLAPDRVLTQPLRWRKPRMIFVNSMSDLFHEAVPDEWIDRIFEVMHSADRHVFQALTKRPERMRDYLRRRYSGSLGATTHLDRRVDRGSSKDLPAAYLAGSANQHPLHQRRAALRAARSPRPPSGIHWVIVGGESGPGFLPMKPEMGCARFAINAWRRASISSSSNVGRLQAGKSRRADARWARVERVSETRRGAAMTGAPALADVAAAVEDLGFELLIEAAGLIESIAISTREAACRGDLAEVRLRVAHLGYAVVAMGQTLREMYGEQRPQAP